MNVSTPGPAADLIEHAAGIIVAKMREPYTAPGHWAGALWQAGMLVAPGNTGAEITPAEQAVIAAAARWSDSAPVTGLIATLEMDLHAAVRNLRLGQRTAPPADRR